jgi:hypothetical protein
MPENLGGVGIDIHKGASILPFNSPGTCEGKLPAANPCINGQAAHLSLPSGAGVNLPSGTNTPGASSVPFVVTGTPGATVTYSFTLGTSKVTGTGVVGANGIFGAVVDLSGFGDGNIAVTVTLTSGGKATTLTGTMGKNTVAPPAPTFSAAAYANIANANIYNVTVTGQAGAIANVIITDGVTPIPGVAGGMDFVGSNGTITIPIDVSHLHDGLLTISVTLTNGAGDSSATTLVVTKDTVAPALSLSTPPYVNNQNVGSIPIVATGEVNAQGTYTLTDGTKTVSGSKAIPASGKWNINANATSLKDGTLTLTVTLTDAAGNATTVTTTLFKDTIAPPAPTVALNPLDDSGASNSDYVTNVTSPRFNVSAQSGATVTVYVNGVVYTGQQLASGSYTVTATATDAYGNVSTAGTAPKTLVVDTAVPTGSFTVSSAKTINGQLATNSQTLTLALSLNGTGSSMSQMAISTDGGLTFGATVAYAATATVTLPSANAVYTIVVRATDAAGNSALFSQTVRLDTAGPTISNTITAPTNNGSYDLGTNPTLAYSASDIDGVATISAKLDSTTSISSGGTINLYTLTAGTHTIVITATDQVGNTSTATLSIQVHPTIAGLRNAVTYGASLGQISSSLQSTLLSTLTSAQNALNAANKTSAKTYLNQFITQVQGANSKQMAASMASLLVNWTQDVIARL